MISDAFEQEQWAQDTLVFGVDEAGMGCLAGSMFVGGVIFPKGYDFSKKLSGLNDSKKLSAKKREELWPIIREDSLSFFCAEVTPETVDEVSAYHARLHAAAEEIKRFHVHRSDRKDSYCVLMDGNVKIEAVPPGIASHCLVKGDSKSYTLAAASILAKCAKDREMLKLDQMHPEYQWAKNKGYGTKAHSSAIEKWGLSKYHRRTYCKKFIKE